MVPEYTGEPLEFNTLKEAPEDEADDIK